MQRTVSYRIGTKINSHKIVKGKRVVDTYTPVLRVISVDDAGRVFEQSAREVARSLEEFRDTDKVSTVEGVPSEDEVPALLADYSDADLAKIGLSRVKHADMLDREIFASQDAYDLAIESALHPSDFSDLVGNGRKGLFNSGDVRALVPVPLSDDMVESPQTVEGD